MVLWEGGSGEGAGSCSALTVCVWAAAHLHLHIVSEWSRSGWTGAAAVGARDQSGAGWEPPECGGA